MISITSLSYQTIEIMKQINFNRLIVGIFLISNILSATEVKWQITGKIIEDKTQAAIPYATVAIYNKIDSNVVTGTISDDNGQFTLERVSLGDYYLKISFMGYQDYILNHLNLILKKHHPSFFELSFLGQRLFVSLVGIYLSHQSIIL